MAHQCPSCWEPPNPGPAKLHLHRVCHGLELAHDLLQAGRQLRCGGRAAGRHLRTNHVHQSARPGCVQWRPMQLQTLQDLFTHPDSAHGAAGHPLRVVQSGLHDPPRPQLHV